MIYCEFRLLTQLQWILRGKERSSLWRVMRNAWRLMVLFYSRDRIVLIGTEPFRAITFWINRLKARHRCFYVASWAWESERFDRGGLDSFRMKQWQRFFRGMVAISPSKPACAAMASYGAKVVHIPWSVDTEVFRPRPRTRRDDGRAVILFVGELWELKGLRLILNLIREYSWERARFVFVGQGPFAAEIRELQAAGRPVEHLGLITDRREVARVMQGADMLILPSIKLKDMEEKFGMVLIEAGACGLPVVASDCIGPRLIIEDGKTGLLIPQNSEQALKDAIERLIGDPELRARMGRNGRAKAVAEYDVKVLARQWEKVFREVSEGTCLSGIGATAALPV